MITGVMITRRGLRGSDVSGLAKSAADVEKLPDQKKILDAVRRPGRRRTRDDCFDYLGQRVDLTVLARLPAYAAGTGEAERALEGLGYL